MCKCIFDAIIVYRGGLKKSRAKFYMLQTCRNDSIIDVLGA